MAGCLLITLPLEFVLGARVYGRAAGLAFAIIPVVIILSIWDTVGICVITGLTQQAQVRVCHGDVRHPALATLAGVLQRRYVS